MTLSSDPFPHNTTSPSVWKKMALLSRPSKIATGILLALSAGGAYADTIPMSTQSAANSELVNMGAYVARAADCMGCHREDYSGGVNLPTPMGNTYSTNITPSIQYGIGNYTEADIEKALRHGKAPNHRLYPAMPYPAYSGMSDEDIHALFAYLQTVPAIDRPPEYETDMTFPFNMRFLMTGWNLINIPNWQPREGMTDVQRRGEYVVNNLAHCGTCHTPRNATMGYQMDKYLSGAMVGEWHAPNITPDTASGIGSWSEAELVTYLREGAIENKAVAAGPMSEVVMHSTRYLTDGDLNAIASYLKAIPAITTEDTVQPVNTAAFPDKYSDDITFNLIEQKEHIAAAKARSGSEAETLYLANCSSCHGADGYGQPDAGYASIIGLSSLRRDNPAPVIHVIANGIEQVVNTRPRMPGFKEDLSAAQIADVTNYVRVNFGGMTDSQVTAEEVTTQLSRSPSLPFLIKNAGWLSILGIIVGLLVLIWLIRWLFNRRAAQLTRQ